VIYSNETPHILCHADDEASYGHHVTGSWRDGRCDVLQTNKQKTSQTPWSESASELYRPSDLRLSAKLVPTFADRGRHVVSVTDTYGRILGFLDRSRYFSFKSPYLYSRGEWTPFQTHYFSENLVVPGIEPGPLDQ
jgi:hypothetical protein